MTRHYFMEFMGTFFLMLAIAFTGNPIAIGLMFMAMIYIGAHVSGGHFNPAYTVAAWLRGKCDTTRAVWYIVAQTAGAALAAGAFYAISRSPFTLELPATINLAIVAVPEFLLTFVLCLLILTVATSDLFRDSKIHGIAAGLTLVAIAFVGGLFNPAAAVGSLLVKLIVTKGVATGIGHSLLVHVVSPLLGGVAAAYVYKFLHPMQLGSPRSF